MTYDAIFAVLKNKMTEVLDELDVSKVDTQKSMKDYGADSLEMVEIVSRTIKEIKVKAPRTEIMGATNIDGLIKVLEKYSNQ